jgi:hypothetical protein
VYWRIKNRKDNSKKRGFIGRFMVNDNWIRVRGVGKIVNNIVELSMRKGGLIFYCWLEFIGL